jgi:hypothetical protein
MNQKCHASAVVLHILLIQKTLLDHLMKITKRKVYLIDKHSIKLL